MLLKLSKSFLASVYGTFRVRMTKLLSMNETILVVPLFNTWKHTSARFKNKALLASVLKKQKRDGVTDNRWIDPSFYRSVSRPANKIKFCAEAFYIYS